MSFSFPAVGAAAFVFLAASISALPAALAQPLREARSYAVAAGPLAEVLLRFAQASGVTLLSGVEPLRGVHSPGLQGDYTIDEGFARLLGGTGYAAARTASGYELVAQPAGAAPEATLAAVEITGKAERGAAPSAYAGGQVARGGRVGLLGDLDYMDTPFSTTNYTAKLVQDTQARTIADVLHNDPSIQPQFPHSSFTDQIQIRGFGQGADAYFVNGLYGIAPTLTTLGELVDRIEVLKGPSAMLNGLAPVGGSVDLRTKRAADLPLTQLTLDYETRSQFGTHLDVGRRFGADNAWGVRVNGVYRAGDTASDHQARRLGLAALGLDYRSSRLRASLDLVDQKQHLDAALSQIYYDAEGKLPEAPKATTNIQQKWEYESSRARIGMGRVEYDLAPDWQLYAAGGVLRGREEQLRGIAYGWTADATFTDSPFYYQGTTRTESAQAGARGRFELGPTRHAVTLDVTRTWRRLGYAENFGEYPEYQSNLYAPVDARRPDLIPLGDLERSEQTVLTGLAFADAVSAFDDRLTVIAGARLQRVRTDGYDAEPTSATFKQRTSHYDEEALTPSVGVVVRPWQQVSFYASFIQGLEAGPSAPSSADYVNAGEVFPPTKTKQAEAGIKFDFKTVGATLAAFRIGQPSGRTTLLGGGLKRFDVDGEQVNRGLELSVFGEPVKGLRPLGGVAYTEAKLTRQEDAALIGKTAPGVPRVAVNLGLEWDVPAVAGLTLTGRAVYKTKQYYFDYDHTIPSWTRFDIGARYAFELAGTPVTLRLSVENLANRGYWESSANGLLLASPRTLKLASSVSF